MSSSTSTAPYSAVQDPEKQVQHQPLMEHGEEPATLPWKFLIILSIVLIGLVIGIGVGNQARIKSLEPEGNSFQLPPGCPSMNYTNSSILCVQVLFSSHLDVGFSAHYNNTYLASQVIDHYFRELLPNAVSVAAQLRQENANLNLSNQNWYIYMTQWWLVSLYLDCPPNMGFYCPTAAEQATFSQAIEQGDITWHALPFNLEAEMLSPDLMDFALQFGKTLSENLNRPGGSPNFMSQRDVPGTTRAIIPYLSRFGIKAISIGANPGSAPIGAGNAYVWKDDATNTSVFTLYHKGGYGGIDVSDAVIIDGFNRVALFDWNSDNAGPYTVSEVKSNFDHIRAAFANDSRFMGREIHVVSTSLDDYVNALASAYAANDITLPVQNFEMGDTWIQGTSSDPPKVAQLRALMRLRSACIVSSKCSADTQAFQNFSRLLLKGVEHTWGGDVKSVLNYTNNATWDAWSNEDLTSVLNSTEYQMLMATWMEQRAWAIDIPLSALPQDHPIVVGAQAEFEALKPKPFNTSGYEQVSDPSVLFHIGKYAIGFDPSTGAISTLVDTTKLKAYADDTHQLGSIVYSTFTEKDFDNFLDQYSYNLDFNGTAWWVAYDFGKKGLDAHAITESIQTSPMLNAMYFRGNADNSSASFLLSLGIMNTTLHTYYGAPLTFSIQIDVNGLTDDNINVTVTNYNKQYTRIPEALWVRFNPLKQNSSSWTVNKIGYDIDPSNIAVNGSRHLHATSSRGASLSNGMQITSSDIYLVSLGEPNPFPTPLGGSETEVGDGINFSMFNNIWGTNYVEWYPFLPSETNQQYRFSLNLFCSGFKGC